MSGALDSAEESGSEAQSLLAGNPTARVARAGGDADLPVGLHTGFADPGQVLDPLFPQLTPKFILREKFAAQVAVQDASVADER